MLREEIFRTLRSLSCYLFIIIRVHYDVIASTCTDICPLQVKFIKKNMYDNVGSNQSSKKSIPIWFDYHILLCNYSPTMQIINITQILIPIWGNNMKIGRDRKWIEKGHSQTKRRSFYNKIRQELQVNNQTLCIIDEKTPKILNKKKMARIKTTNIISKQLIKERSITTSYHIIPSKI